MCHLWPNYCLCRWKTVFMLREGWANAPTLPPEYVYAGIWWHWTPLPNGHLRSPIFLLDSGSNTDKFEMFHFFRNTSYWILAQNFSGCTKHLVYLISLSVLYRYWLLHTHIKKALVWRIVDMLLAEFSPDSPDWVTWVEWGLLQNTKGTREKSFLAALFLLSWLAYSLRGRGLKSDNLQAP